MKQYFIFPQGRNINLVSPKQLRVARAAMGLTVREAARMCAVSQAILTRMEIGAFGKVSAEKAQQVIRHYRLTGIEFMRDDESEGIWYRD